MRVEVAGIPIEIERKRVKNLNISITVPEGDVHVSAPFYVSDESIMEFIHSKLKWINKHRAEVIEQKAQAEREYVTGEQLCVFGCLYPLRVEYAEKSTVVLHKNEVVLTVRKHSTAEQREAVVREWYRALLKEMIGVYLPKWERITGIYCNTWNVKYMTTRWGSCNVKEKRIWLSLALVKRPLVCLEHVILHELMHLRVRDHGAAFDAQIERYMPNWREIDRQLNGK